MSVPTDPYELLHWNMIRAHYVFTKGYEIIVKNLASPPTNDLKNFLGYCEAWGHSVVHHHDVEEAGVFPALNKKMDFAHEQEQHKAVHDFLDKFLEKVKEAQKDHSKFDAPVWLELVESAKDTIFTHFDEEVIHIEAEKLKAAQFTEQECKDIVANMEKQAKAQGDPFLVVPFMRSHTPAEFKDVWPPMPWVLRKVVIPYMLAKRYSGYWKYAPYPTS
ncbi:hypothetical protein EIP91_007493 [Steccherinum ochraceum]|uniref:Hemerythrin-like domain-containing protein n=1 Tax=Steccherinum ochraceum TaxID=92696 RepID=A0A4R0R6W3_9APHY|nr:hypothetical protein EIP91_007493 [Steccherinum ochraceum]